MRLTVIGAGYLGLTHAVCMADLGHHVLALDVDAEKVARAARAETPFFEPGLQPLLRKNLDAGRLRFTGSWQQVARFGKVHFVCVGTPSGVNGAADLSYVHAAVNALAPMLTGRCLVVGKSTVPVGTARQLLARLRAATPAGPKVELAWNPEFLSEGEAVQGSLAPDRVVLGVTSDWAADLLKRVYAPLLAANVPALVMDLETAELVKISANAFLATKISFINAMAEVCEAVGADVLQLAKRSVTTSGSAPGISRPASALAEDACPSTSARSGPAQRTGDSLRSPSCCAASTPSTSAVGHGLWSSPETWPAGR